MAEISVIYLTANEISDSFASNLQRVLREATDAPIITASLKPTDFGDKNIVFTTPRGHLNIYWMAYQSALQADTKYIAIAEDDVLYSPEHFKHRPSQGKFAYNISCWGIYTWTEPVFSHRVHGGRRNHGMLICERDLYVEAMKERFDKYPDWSKVNIDVWAEPGKYERHLGVTERGSETFYTVPPNIMFSHSEGLSKMGKRKRMGELRAIELPYWGTAQKIRSLYEKSGA